MPGGRRGSGSVVDYAGVGGLFRARDRVGSSPFDKGAQLKTLLPNAYIKRYQCILHIHWVMLVM